MIQELVDIFRVRYSGFLPSIEIAQSVNKDLFESIGEEIIQTLFRAMPKLEIGDLARYYAEYTMEQNLLQARYEISGSYPVSSFDEANRSIYQNEGIMTAYMIGLMMTQFLWPHHLKVFEFFGKNFVEKLNWQDQLEACEFAPGHGLFGRWFLQKCPKSRLIGVDISPKAIELAISFVPIDLLQRATYVQGDVQCWGKSKPGEFDVVISGELLEHIESPTKVLRAIYSRLKEDSSRAFVTAALTAANIDHIYEFKCPEEVVNMAAGEGLIVTDSLLVQPPTFPTDSQRVPRVFAMVVQRA